MYRAGTALKKVCFSGSSMRSLIQLSSCSNSRHLHDVVVCCHSNFGSGRLHYHSNAVHHHRHDTKRAYSVGSEPFLSGSSSSYIEAMYESWMADKSSVHKVSDTFEWAGFPLVQIITTLSLFTDMNTNHCMCRAGSINDTLSCLN